MQSLLCLTCLTLFLQGSYGKFVIERKKDGSDRFIEIEGKKTDKDESTFRSDGTCFGTKKHIASAVGDSRIRCYTGTAMKYIGNGKGVGRIMTMNISRDISYFIFTDIIS